MPGQLELYNSDNFITKIIEQFRNWEWRLCSIHLSDSLYVSDSGKFISVILCALSVMVNLEVAQINVLSKVDLMPSNSPYNLEYFEQLPDLKHLLRLVNVCFLILKFTICYIIKLFYNNNFKKR